jgi:hypothetical protein
MVPGWVPFKIVSDSPAIYSRWLLWLKIEISSIFHCCFSPFVHISHFNLLLRKHWANCNQTLVEWSLGGPLQKCVRWSRLPTKMFVKLKIEKKGWWNLKEIFSSETTEPISTKLCWNDPWVVPFQRCVQHFRPPTKMAATAELNLT